MELLWLLIKVVGLIVAMMGSGFVLGYFTARDQYQQELWDKELLLRVLQKDLEDDRA